MPTAEITNFPSTPEFCHNQDNQVEKKENKKKTAWYQRPGTQAGPRVIYGQGTRYFHRELHLETDTK